MKKLLAIILIFSLFAAHAQKLYVWCPDSINVKPRSGFLENDTIDIVVFDGRALTSNSKIECESLDVVSSIEKNIKKAYPSATLNILGDTGYYKDPKPNRITIKIGIAAYQAGFGADVTVGIGSIGGNISFGAVPKGEWNGVTGYYIRLYDYRNAQTKKFTSSISKITSKPNMGGYITAKHCLNTTFTDANQDLLFFIDNNLTE